MHSILSPLNNELKFSKNLLMPIQVTVHYLQFHFFASHHTLAKWNRERGIAAYFYGIIRLVHLS